MDIFKTFITEHKKPFTGKPSHLVNSKLMGPRTFTNLYRTLRDMTETKVLYFFLGEETGDDYDIADTKRSIGTSVYCGVENNKIFCDFEIYRTPYGNLFLDMVNDGFVFDTIIRGYAQVETENKNLRSMLFGPRKQFSEDHKIEVICIDLNPVGVSIYQNLPI